MSTVASSGGVGVFSGFTKLCKGFSVIIVACHILVRVFPSSLAYLALIPARTIPFAWNLITAGFIDRSIYGVILGILSILTLGKLLEPVWGSKEFLKFIFIVNFLTYICVFITAIALYYVTTQENYLYMPIYGLNGALAGLLVGIKQILPEQELYFIRIKAKWFPSIVVLLATFVSFFTAESVRYLPTLIFGTFTSWIYLRFLQRKAEAKIRGDPNADFSFATFFPEFLRPVIEPMASILYWIFCGRFARAKESLDYTLGGSPLPGSDPADASRRRERGARALEERLAIQELTGSRSTEESKKDEMESV